MFGNIGEAVALQPDPHFQSTVERFRRRPARFLVGFLQVMQGIENECFGENSWCRLLGFPVAIRAGRDLHALSVQGVADLLVCVSTFALPVEELGD
ncbi:hypothetical protein D3C74_35190 [compost metagenome]